MANIATPVIVTSESQPGVVILTSQITVGIGSEEHGIPAGGTTEQSLVKSSNENYVTMWKTIIGTLSKHVITSGSEYLAEESVATSNYIKGSITGGEGGSSKIAGSTITGYNIAPKTIAGGETGNIVKETLTKFNYGPLSIEAAAIKEKTITGGETGKLVKETLTPFNYGPASVEAAAIKAGAITPEKFSVTKTLIAGQSLVSKGVLGTELEWKTITGGGGGGETKVVKLGEVTGTIEVTLEKSPAPRYIELTLKGNTKLKFKEPPTEFAECILEITQSASSEFTFEVEGISWVGTKETPEFNKGKSEKTEWAILVVSSGEKIIGSYAGAGPKGGKKITSHYWAPSGETKEETLGGMFIERYPFGEAATEEQHLVGVMFKIASGTYAKFEVLKNGEAVEWAGAVKILEAKEAAAKKAPAASVELRDEDFLNIKITGLSGTPKILSVTLFIEHN